MEMFSSIGLKFTVAEPQMNQSIICLSFRII